MKTFDEYAQQSPEQDPLDTIRNYRDEVRLDLLKNGEWDDELVAEVDNALLEKAQAQGIDLGEDPVAAFNRPRKEDDEDILSRFSVDENVRAAAAELRALKTVKDLYAHDPAEYQSKLEAAELTFNEAATPEARNAARRQALTSGRVPYVKYQDADGNYQMEVSPELAAISGNDAALAKVFEANPALDKGDIPELRRRLQVPDGYEVPAFMLDRRNDFSQVVNEIAKNDPVMSRELDSIRRAIDAGNEGNLDPSLESVNTSLSAAGISSEFSPEERKNFLKDYVVSMSSPKVDEANVDANLRKLSTGEVHVPFGVFLNKPLFDKTMAESTLIPDSQKEALIASRNDRLATFAQDTFPLLTRRNPEFATFYDKAKSEGKLDAEILDAFMSDPDNQSTVLDFAQGTLDSVAEGFGGLALYPLALAGNETARDVVSGLQQQDADRRAYAQLFGKNLGMGYDLTRLVAPVAADVGVSLLTSGAASGLVGAKTAAKSAIKSTLASSLKGETKSLARSFAEGAARRQGVEAATNSLDNVLSAAGRDIAQKFTQSATTASYLATAFNRSAGATYVQLHNTLEKQKNPDGSPKYTPEQAREIALNHGLLAGTLTAAVTGGFSMLGAAGMERIYDGLTRRQLNGVFDRLKRDWGKLAPEVREGLDVSSADAFLSSVVRKAVTPMWQSVGRPIAEEGAEEGLDEFLQYFNQQVATGDKIDVVDAVKQAGYAAMLGGAMGGTVTGINSAVRGDTVSASDETAVRRQTLLDTARKLDAAHSPNTAAILRRFAATGIPTRPEESLPEGDAAAGDVEAPGGQSVAEPEAVTGFREELQQLQGALPELQAAPENETPGQLARREQRIAQSQARAQELENLIANYDASTIEMPEAKRPMRKSDPGPTVLPTGPTIELGASQVQFTQAPGTISEIDQMPDRDGQPTTRWTASDGLGQAEGIIEDGVLTISNIEAKARGTRFLDRVIAQSPVAEISVPLQSPRMQSAMKKLVDSGVLVNPSEPRGVERYPTRFTIANAQTDEDVTTGSDNAADARSSDTGAGAEGTDSSADTPSGTGGVLPTAVSPELDVTDILYDPPADSPLNRDEAAAVAGVLNGEQSAASNREVIDRYLGSQGIVTEGLSDADATALLGVADAEEAVRVLGNRKAPSVPKASESELAAFDFDQGTQPFLEAVAVRGKPEHRKAAKLLLKFPAPQITRVDLPGAAFAGAFVPSTGQVLINSARRGPRGAVDTALHELLHAATEESVLNPTPEQAAILKRLDRVRQTILKRTNDRGMRYALSNNAEFITHAFTDPEFLKQVGELTPKGEKNWAQVIIDTIRDLLNGRSRTESERISESLMNDLMALVESGVPSMRQQVNSGKVRMQPATDAEYLAAVEAGDMTTAQQMVDQAAEKAGYEIKAYHGSPVEGLTKFDPDNATRSFGGVNRIGTWWTTNPQQASKFAANFDSEGKPRDGRVYAGFIKPGRVFKAGGFDNLWRIVKHRAHETQLNRIGKEGVAAVREYFRNSNVDTIEISDTRGDDLTGTGDAGTYYVTLNPNQIKSADPVTYDSKGNVVPLSKRFNETSNDIRFQPADDTHTAVSVKQLAESFAPEGVDLTIDFDELARDMEGVSGVNAEDMVAAMVNRDVARQAGLAALGEDVPAEEAERLADTFRLTITGNLPDSDIAFYRGNPTARERLVRYLQGAVNALWERLKLRFDPRTAMYVDRIAREVAVANDGYRTRSQIKQFDPNNPAETEAMLRFQPAEGDESPEFRYTNFTEVNDGNVLYSSTPADMQKPGWLSRMFTRRDDLRRPLSTLKVDGKALYGVMEAKFNRLNPLYEKAIKEENPDMDIVKQAVGSTAPLLTPDEENRINTEVDRRMETASNIAQPRIDAARAVKDKAVRAARRANSVESEDTALAVFEEAKRQANADQERAMTAIQEWSRSEKDRSMTDRAAELRRVQGLAMQQLQGNAPITYKWASEMRDTVNEFQDRLAKLYKTTRPELSATIDRSRGVYLVRSYAFHQEPAMAEMILNDPRFDELRATSIEYFGRELAQDKFETLKNDPNFRNTPESDLMEVARQDVEDQARLLFEDFIAGHENQYTASASGSLKTEFQRFMTKRNLDPEISAILQEIEDPAYNLGRTLSAVSGILFSQKMLAAVKKDGLETGTIITKAEKDANPAKYRNWEPLVAASVNSQAYAPLAGYYASPEDKMAWDAAFNASRNAAKDTSGKAAETLNKLILGAAGASLGVATLGSPGYQSRNVVGGLIMALAQGVNVFSPKGAKSIKTSFENAFSKNPSDQEFLEKMVALRVLGDGAQIQYLRDFLTRYRQNPLGAMDWAAEQGMKISPEAVKALGKGKSGWNKMVDFLGRTAEFTETWQNTAIYLHELQAMKDTGLYTEQEAEQEAARRTKMVTASKSEASQALNSFSKHPVSALIAPFARFKSEMVRTVVNTYRLGIADVKKGRELNNDVLLDHGLQRLASAATIHGLVSIMVPLILQRIMGISDDEDKAIRAAMPEYSKNSSFWYDRNADGGIRTWDLTFANPFALLADPLTQMIRATRTGDAAEIPKAAQRFFTEELLGENILAGNVLDLSRNRDETTNMPVWLESDDAMEKVLKGAMHLVEGSYTPAAAKKIYQAYQATNRPVKDDEQFFFTPAGVLLGAVAPVKPRDYPVKDLAYRAFRNLSKTNSELWLITNPISSPKGMGEGEAANLYGERVQAATKIWKQAHQLSKSFASMGMTKGQILSVMQDAGLSKDRSEKAIRGFTDRPILASDKLKDIREIDPRRHDELVRAMRSQPRLIDVR